MSIPKPLYTKTSQPLNQQVQDMRWIARIGITQLNSDSQVQGAMA